jgi:hypothetical protein
LVEAILDVVIGLVRVGFLLQRAEGDLGGGARLEEAARADGFEADARVVINGLHLQEGERVFHAVTPVTEDAGGGGAGTVIGRAEHVLEERFVHDVLPLVDPEGFGEVVGVFLVGLAEGGGPLLRGGDDLVAKLTPGSKVEPNKLLFLMESLSDNTASVWCEDLAGGGATINAWMEAHGYRITRVNSRVAGRESDYKQYGWGQTTPREMAEMLVAIRERRAVSPAADEHLDRMLGRAYWDGEALSSVPSDVHVISKQGAVNASRSEVLLVSAPHGSYVLCVITKNQVDQSWDDSNAGFRLLRAASAIVWQHMEPERPYAAALAGPRWP